MNRLLALGFAIVILAACSEVEVTEEPEFTRYPYLEPFIVSDVEIRSVSQDLDSAQYSFRYKTSEPAVETFLAKIDSHAAEAGWTLNSSQPRSRLFVSTSESSPYPHADVEVRLTIDRTNRWVSVSTKRRWRSSKFGITRTRARLKKQAK